MEKHGNNRPPPTGESAAKMLLTSHFEDNGDTATQTVISQGFNPQSSKQYFPNSEITEHEDYQIKPEHQSETSICGFKPFYQQGSIIHPAALTVNPIYLPPGINCGKGQQAVSRNNHNFSATLPQAEHVDLHRAVTTLDEDVLQNYPVVTKSVSKVQELGQQHTSKDGETIAARRVMKFLFDLWRKGSLVDVKLQTADADVYAHRVILAAYSDVMMKAFTEQNLKPMSVLDVYDVSSADVKQVLSFLYTADIYLTDRNIKGILTSSIHLDIQILVKICVHYLSQYTTGSALSYYAICKDCNLLLLAASIWRYICENFEAVSSSDEFEKCTVQQVTTLLSDDRIKVASEMSVLDSAIRWLRSNSYRVSNVWDVLDCVRFQLFDPEHIPKLEKHPYLSTLPETLPKLYRAVCFHSLQESGSAIAKQYAAKPRPGPLDHLFPDIPKTDPSRIKVNDQVICSSVPGYQNNARMPRDLPSEGPVHYRQPHPSPQNISCNGDFNLQIPTLSSVLQHGTMGTNSVSPEINSNLNALVPDLEVPKANLQNFGCSQFKANEKTRSMSPAKAVAALKPNDNVGERQALGIPIKLTSSAEDETVITLTEAATNNSQLCHKWSNDILKDAELHQKMSKSTQLAPGTLDMKTFMSIEQKEPATEEGATQSSHSVLDKSSQKRKTKKVPRHQSLKFAYSYKVKNEASDALASTKDESSTKGGPLNRVHVDQAIQANLSAEQLLKQAQGSESPAQFHTKTFSLVSSSDLSLTSCEPKQNYTTKFTKGVQTIKYKESKGNMPEDPNNSDVQHSSEVHRVSINNTPKARCRTSIKINVTQPKDNPVGGAKTSHKIWTTSISNAVPFRKEIILNPTTDKLSQNQLKDGQTQSLKSGVPKSSQSSPDNKQGNSHKAKADVNTIISKAKTAINTIKVKASVASPDVSKSQIKKDGSSKTVCSAPAVSKKIAKTPEVSVSDGHVGKQRKTKEKNSKTVVRKKLTKSSKENVGRQASKCRTSDFANAETLESRMSSSVVDKIPDISRSAESTPQGSRKSSTSSFYSTRSKISEQDIEQATNTKVNDDAGATSRYTVDHKSQQKNKAKMQDTTSKQIWHDSSNMQEQKDIQASESEESQKVEDYKEDFSMGDNTEKSIEKDTDSNGSRQDERRAVDGTSCSLSSDSLSEQRTPEIVRSDKKLRKTSKRVSHPKLERKYSSDSTLGESTIIVAESGDEPKLRRVRSSKSKASTGQKDTQKVQLFMTGGLSTLENRKGLAVSVFCETHQRWKTISRRRFELHHHATVFFGGKIYIIGGAIYNSSSPNNVTGATNKVHSFDVAKRKWRIVQPMLEKRVYHAAVAHEAAIYVVGGEDLANQYSDAVEMFSSTTSSWHIIARLLGGGRIGAGAAVHNNRLFVVGGYNPKRKSFILKDVLSLHLDTYSWEVHRPMPIPRCHSVLACVNRKLYLIGGMTTPPEDSDKVVQGPTTVNYVHRFNEKTESWTPENSLPSALYDATSAIKGKKIYIMGGMKTPSNTPLRQVYSFDAENKEWTVENIVIPRAMVGASASAIYS